MTDADETVYVAGRSSGGGTSTYHEDPDCRYFKEDSTVHEYTRDRIIDRREPCSGCCREVDT
jgi:hypothetical protein